MTEFKQRRWVVTDAVVFDLVLWLFFTVFAVTSLQYNVRARSIPLAVGVIGALMMTLQLLADSVPRVRAKLRFVSQGGLLSRPNALAKRREVESAASAPLREAQPGEAPASWFRVFRVVLWLAGFVALLAWTHYLVAVGLFTFLVTAVEAGEGWKRSLLLTLCVCGSFYLLFQVILGAQL